MLYQLLCLARPMAAGELSAMMQKVGNVVFNAGGVVTDVKSYGRQYLAYKIRGVHGRFDQADIWELEFAVPPEALAGLSRELRVDESVLRYVFLRRDALPKLDPPRKMFANHETWGHLLRSPRLPGARAIPLAEAQAAAAAAAAAVAAPSAPPPS
ncbi:MAG: hypothetical protein J3K34DRAFT_428817 [Monoraphidium minutum]|nr:MAG: hypothetical protein J3K34DRAFT_428817 [Monoraphidium minutum]